VLTGHRVTRSLVDAIRARIRPGKAEAPHRAGLRRFRTGEAVT
jgi:hypothetical protein